MKWSNPPALSVISGSQTHLVRREVERALAALKQRRLVRVSGRDYETILDTIQTPSVFDFQDVLLLIESPEKISDTNILKSHALSGESDIAVLLAFEGNVPSKAMFSNLLKEIPDQYHLKFPLPKPWEEAAQAVKFCIEEAQELGLSLDSQSASPLVKVIGTDYGALSYEIKKAGALARSQGRREIRRKDLGRTIAPVFQHEAFTVVNALAEKNGKQVLQNLGFVKNTSRDDPTMKVCGLLGSKLGLWIRAAHLASAGYGPDEAAQRLGIHPFPFKKDLLPITQRWTVPSLISLLKGVASVERGVKSGLANPWVQLNSLLYAACQE